MSTALAPRDWRDRAACRDKDPDLFFPLAPPNTDAYAEQAARAMLTCGTCPVRVPCHDFAVSAAEQWGVWGGTTPGERETARLHLTRGVA
jgi:WhiB family transcriptional regulator, redox-sensing transcriptional regulator